MGDGWDPCCFAPLGLGHVVHALLRRIAHCEDHVWPVSTDETLDVLDIKVRQPCVGTTCPWRHCGHLLEDDRVALEEFTEHIAKSCACDVTCAEQLSVNDLVATVLVVREHHVQHGWVLGPVVGEKGEDAHLGV